MPYQFQAGPLLKCAGRQLDLSHPRIMAILNVTPDSFSDGGHLFAGGRISLDKACARAARLIAEGADIIDIGGESTRPGAAAVSVQEEMDRVLPVVERLAQEFDVVLSVDTSTPEVMTEAARLGAGLINDVRALNRPGAVAAAAATGLPVCLMHMPAEPAEMQRDPRYADVVAEVAAYLKERAETCTRLGIARHNILLDPGFGFGKTSEHNLILLNRLERLHELGFPLLVGLSRKSLIGHVLGRPVAERLAGSLALAVLAVSKGAAIVRVHDVWETADAVRLCAAVMREHIP